MNYGAVIIATGISSRMEQYLERMEDGELGLAERVIINFRSAGVEDIVLVTGAEAAELEKNLKSRGVTFLKNENYASSDKFASAVLGLGYLSRRCDRIFFCPVDVPFFTADTVRAMMRQDASVVVPFCAGRLGHPLLFSREVLPEIFAYRGGRGMRGAFEALPSGRVSYVEVSDQGAFMGAVSEADYRKLIDAHNKKLMRPELKVRLSRERPFFGPGVVTLLKQIDTLGSVREACEKTGISYSKAWTIIHTCEEELGYPIVLRYPGGRNGGAASVSEKGLELIRLYEEFSQRVNAAALDLYNEIFHDGKLLLRDE